jgi:hypothetical protein
MAAPIIDCLYIYIDDHKSKFPEYTGKKFHKVCITIRRIYPTTLDSLEKFVNTNAAEKFLFSCDEFGDDDFERISKIFVACPCITTLCVTRVHAKHLKSLMQSNRGTLTRVRLQSVGDLSDYCDTLSGMDHLKSIDVSHMDLANLKKMVVPLSRCTTLKNIDFSSCGITAKHMHHVARIISAMPLLDKLMLSKNRFGNLGCFILAPAIKAHPTLRVICLNECAIKSAGATALFEALETDTTVELLELQENMITLTAAPAMSRMIVRNQHLMVLSLDENMLGTKTLTRLIKLLEFNTALVTFSISNMKMHVDTQEIIKTLDWLDGKNNTIHNIDDEDEDIDSHPLLDRNNSHCGNRKFY